MSRAKKPKSKALTYLWITGAVALVVIIFLFSSESRSRLRASGDIQSQLGLVEQELVGHITSCDECQATPTATPAAPGGSNYGGLSQYLGARTWLGNAENPQECAEDREACYVRGAYFCTTVDAIGIGKAINGAKVCLKGLKEFDTWSDFYWRYYSSGCRAGRPYPSRGLDEANQGIIQCATGGAVTLLSAASCESLYRGACDLQYDSCMAPFTPACAPPANDNTRDVCCTYESDGNSATTIGSVTVSCPVNVSPQACCSLTAAGGQDVIGSREGSCQGPAPSATVNPS